MATPADKSQPPRPQAKPGIPRYVGWLILASIFVVPTLAYLYYSLFGPRDMPRLDRQVLEAARAQWVASGVRSYDAKVTVTGGSNHSTIELKVRNGQVVDCRENGVRPERVYWDQWTIGKQFDMMAEDIEKDETGGFRKRENVKVTLHANINPQYGFPDHYLRRIHGRSPLHFQWRNVEFTPVAE